MPNETVDQEWTRSSDAGAGVPLPGLVLVFAGGKAALAPIPPHQERIELGRGMIGGVHVDDPCMSRKHAEVTRAGAAWRVCDLGSRNGSAIDGEPLTGERVIEEPRVLRVGDTLLIFAKDLRPFGLHSAAAAAERVCGPTLSAAWAEIARASQAGDTLHLVGETGSGKELAAQLFHDSRGPLVAVNCATIPHGVAERLLFGAKKGAYSGADADSRGYLQEADGGTLFLDEIGELDLAVQAKLLRAIESREVLALGASKPEKIAVRICSATHKSLRAEVTAGRFREDLFFRIGIPEVALPPLRARAEDIPPLIALELSRIERSLKAHVSFVEACLLRHWPGNVRELFVAVRTAARAAINDQRVSVEARDLSSSAGQSFRSPETLDDRPPPPEPPLGGDALTREALEAALTKAGGNVSRAARTLGLHRTQLRRKLEELAIDPDKYRG